jgi:hypothetical protein
MSNQVLSSIRRRGGNNGPLPSSRRIAVTTSSGHTIVDANELSEEENVKAVIALLKRHRQAIVQSARSPVSDHDVSGNSEEPR